MSDSEQARHIRAYGDTTGDGMVQLSFTLPVPAGPKAEAAAALFARKMGLDPAMVVHAKGIGPRFTFFVVYGRSPVVLDLDEVHVQEREYALLTAKEVNLEIRSRLQRRMVVVGGTVGTDAHTVGLDAILNVKGFAGEKGLEHYREIRVVNLGAQVDAAELVDRAAAERADAVLVSQVVTQRDAHLHHVREVADALADRWPADLPRPLLVVGGPRFDPAAAADIGADRVFVKGTTPREVASYLVHALTTRPAAGAAARAAAR
ncbi:MAG TPA: OAM dimerization domain-containing protein [Mycobacteriales bacterium]|nr:OAM dimerization domain-containing protein [Mycobacteriales bacterium]